MIRLQKTRSKCLDCELQCQFRGKDSNRKNEDLAKVPENCGYKKEAASIEAISDRLAESLSQQLKTVSASNAAAWAAIESVVKSYQQWEDYFSKVGHAAVLPPLGSYRDLQPYLEPARRTARVLSTSVPYFPSKEFLVLKEPIKVPRKSVATKYIERLNSCPRGERGWSNFQDLCKEALMHLFVPPLLKPFEQSRTEAGLHIRDLIFDIPYSVSRFWGYIRDKFDSSALVVECKNYSSCIEGNQIVISSKYFGKNRLGRFGIVFSRLGPAESATKEMKRLWTEDNKLVLCLMDDHLIRMIKLKEKNRKPEIMIDKAIHEFLRSLE